MASTPSASALNAVLRCRGNIWTRNPPSKRPATSGYSLGLGGGAQRDSQPERTRSGQTSAKEAFLQGDRVVVGGRLTVACTSPRVDGRLLRGQQSRDIKELVYSKVSQVTGHAQLAAQRASVRLLAHRLTPKLPGADTCSKITPVIKCETHRGSCKFVQRTSGSPALKVSVTSPVVLEHAGHLLNTLKSTCLSFTALGSGLMWRRRSSTTADAQHLLCQEDERVVKHYVLPANGRRSADFASCRGDPGCGQKITGDRPD